MGATYAYTCSKCGYSVSTSGPWEFYRDIVGERKLYGHPLPISEEAKQRGIYGLSAELYCPNCDETFDLILVEFDRPSHDKVSVWRGMALRRPKFRVEEEVECPKCANKGLILNPLEDKEIGCPRCHKGKLTGEMGWIS